MPGRSDRNFKTDRCFLTEYQTVRMKIQSARSSLHVRGRKMNVTQALVCTGTVIGGLNMVNKGKYAPVTLEHRVYTPTRLPSFFIILLLSWPAQHRKY